MAQNDRIKEWLSQPNGMPARLQQLRKRAGMTGTEMANSLGWSQPKISRIENGKQLPSESDLNKWLESCGADEQTATELRQMLAQAESLHRQWRQETQATGVQVSYDQLGREARRIRNFEILTIPGLIQTAAFARARLLEHVRFHGYDESEVDSAVAARMRRQEIVYDQSKKFEFVVTEAALRILLCPREVLVGQLDRLMAVMDMPNVLIGVIPFGVELPFEPQNRFILFDDVAMVETSTGDTAHRGEEAEVYHAAMDELVREAVTGEDARALIMRALADLRTG